MLRQHAQQLADAGAAMLVFELISSALARELTPQLSIPVIGIAAGAACSGQVLVLHDLLGLALGPLPRFVRDFMCEGGGIVRLALDAQRAQAVGLSRELRGVAAAVQGGACDWPALEAAAMAALRAAGWLPDCVAVRRQADGAAPAPPDARAAREPLVVLAAATLGTTRLIDNLEIPCAASPATTP